MNKIKIRNYQIFSVIFTFVFGTLLHFTYSLSGENLLVGIFSTINESVWEHLKLLFFPMLFTIIIGYFYIGKNELSFLCSKVLGMVISMIFVVVFFYTYTGIIEKNIAVIDISSFFIATILGEYVSYKLITNRFKCNKEIAIIVLIILLICFMIFTYFTPDLGIFQDALTK